MNVISAFLRWRSERLPWLPFIGVAVVVARAAGELEIGVVIAAFAWIVALRLCDDVASRDRDKDLVPLRAVVAGPAAVYVRAAAVAVIVAVAVAVGLGVGVSFVTLLFALVAVEHAPFAELARRLLVLVKYPVMALLLSSSSSLALPAQLVPLYACFVVDEFFTGRARLPLRALPFALTFFWLCVT